MYTEFIAQSDYQQQERELTQRLERRRVAAERAVQQHGGERLALIAHLARKGRAASQSRGPRVSSSITGRATIVPNSARNPASTISPTNGTVHVPETSCSAPTPNGPIPAIR
ncbi:MAG: hypothetical protein JWM93_3862 [Frankiales bacterium]|nr:hypothetical protein [Frankiales bacterium]